MDKSTSDNDSDKYDLISNPSELISYGYSIEKEEKFKPWVKKISVTYNQPADCCDEKDNIQAITLTSVDNGDAPFIRISIPNGEYDPGYWAIDDGNDLIEIIHDFQKRINYIENE